MEVSNQAAAWQILAMYYVYILKLSNKNLYTGYTSNLKRRISEHQLGNVVSTSKHLPVKLIYYEAFLCQKDALNQEKYLKSGGHAKKILKDKLKYSLLGL